MILRVTGSELGENVTQLNQEVMSLTLRIDEDCFLACDLRVDGVSSSFPKYLDRYEKTQVEHIPDAPLREGVYGRPVRGGRCCLESWSSALAHGLAYTSMEDSKSRKGHLRTGMKSLQTV